MDDEFSKDLENEPLLKASQDVDYNADLVMTNEQATEARRGKLLLISFLIMCVVGLGNKIFQKLQTIPMQEYPFFLSILTTFIYVPASFAYILPMIKWGSLITPEQRAIPKYKFAIMGVLDGIAGVMQVFAVNYITNGGLLVLLQQAAIPISMVITKVMLKAKYKSWNYLGAVVVVIGLCVVLYPNFFVDSKKKDPHPEPKSFGAWVIVMLVSCVPMTLSSVYKEKALGETEIDVVYLNGWVAIFQLLVTLVFALPTCLIQDIPVKTLPNYMWNGFQCYIGTTVSKTSCDQAPLFVNIYMAFNLLYNIFIILILKYGSSNILWLAMTLMVPAGNAAFALPFVPGSRPMTVFDIAGLVVIMFGLIIYRFWAMLVTKAFPTSLQEKLASLGLGPALEDDEDQLDPNSSVKYPLLGSMMGMETYDPIYVVRPERKLIRSQHQIRANYFSKLGIAAGQSTLPIN